jgi:DNA topoisomerase-1
MSSGIILLIVESPNKVNKIQGILGSSYRVMSSVGHVRDLPEKGLGVTIPDFKPQYVPDEDKKKILAGLAAAAKEASAVVLATDPDREGEGIAWHLADILRLKEPRRVTYTEITEPAIKAAVQKARPLNMNLVRAYETRRILDRLVGYLVTPGLRNKTGQKLSAGRVQSPAVRLVVDREREIKNFQSITHYGVDLIFGENPDDEWKAAWLPKEGWLEPGQDYFLDKSQAAKVAAVRNLKVLYCQEGEAKVSPPAPYITTSLQQAGSNSLGMNPKETMEVAQKIFANGHITYMRTDFPNLSNEAVAAIRAWAAEKQLPVPSKPRMWKSKAGAQEAHEAIRPTHFEVENAGDSDTEQALYKLIRLRAIASQLADATYAVRVISFEGDVEGKGARFEARGRTMLTPGWKILTPIDQTKAPDEAEDEVPNPVPKLEPDSLATARDGVVVTKATKPPARFTEAGLVKELEKRGIGRPSTYAFILDRITNHYRYVTVEGKRRQLMPTQAGELMVDSLLGWFGFLEYDYTVHLEDELDQIAGGKTAHLGVLKAAYDQLGIELKSAGFTSAGFGTGTAEDIICPKCGAKTLRHLVKKKTADHKGYNFWACQDKDNCGAIFNDENGQPQEKKPVTVSEFKCGKCGKPLVHRKGVSKFGAGGHYEFFGCLGYPKCKIKYEVIDGKPDYEGEKRSK